MARREDRKDKPAKPREPVLSLEQRKAKMREEIRHRFQIAFGYEDQAVIPNRRSK